MNIAVLINYIYPDAGGGTSKYVRDFAVHAAAAGHAVEVFCCTREPGMAGTRQEGNITVTRVLLTRGDLGLLRFGNRKKYAEAFVVRAGEFDIINIHGIALLPYRFLRKHRDRLLLTIHGSLKKEIGFDFTRYPLRNLVQPWRGLRIVLKWMYAGWLENRTFPLARRRVVMSNYVREYISRMYPRCAADGITVIPIGIDPPDNRTPQSGSARLRERFGIRETGTVFFTLRRLVPRMGLENLVRAFSLLEDARELTLIIAGKGELYGRLEALIAELGLEDTIRLAGYVTDDEKEELYSRADCFVVPTEDLEGFGIVTLEALVHGLPVIGTPAGATPEILNDFQPDLIAGGTDARALADAIRCFLSGNGGSADRNREKVLQRYEWNQVMERYRGVFKDFGAAG